MDSETYLEMSAFWGSAVAFRAPLLVCLLTGRRRIAFIVLRRYNEIIGSVRVWVSGFFIDVRTGLENLGEYTRCAGNDTLRDINGVGR